LENKRGTEGNTVVQFVIFGAYQTSNKCLLFEIIYMEFVSCPSVCI